MPATHQAMTALIRAEWVTFRRRRSRLVAVGSAILLIILFSLLPAVTTHSSCSEGPVEVPCPTDPVTPDQKAVSDQFFFAHRPLAENGSITVRLTSMTGIITYPPPDHDEIVPGLVPWAKAGIIVKDGLDQGSSYAALMTTGSHGVRMQYDYAYDLAGRPGTVSAESPRWLRLTRAGGTITGSESVDGERWTKVGTANLTGLPDTVQVGLFAASPGDLTLRPVGLGATIGESRFTQTTAVFDQVTLEGTTTDEWSKDTVGELGHTDWEKYHQAAGLNEAGGTLTVTGSGDIGPLGTVGGHRVEGTLSGLVAGLIVLIVVAVRFATTGIGGRALAAKAVVVGAVSFGAGLIAAVIAVPVGTAILQINDISVLPVSALTLVRVIVGAAGLLAVGTIFALALGALLRRTWAALVGALVTVVLPYLLGVVPLLPEGISDWLLRVTPGAGFAILQTVREYPQVTAQYVPYAGYFPLPGWAGMAVLCGYAAVTLWLARRRRA